MIQEITKILFFAGLIILLFIFFLSDSILSLWGKEFTNAKNCLIILCVGQFFNIGTGAVGYLLSMTGHEKVLRNITILSLILSVLLNLVLINLIGILGAAIATSSVIIINNLVKAFFVYKKIGISINQISNFEEIYKREVVINNNIRNVIGDASSNPYTLKLEYLRDSNIEK